MAATDMETQYDKRIVCSLRQMTQFLDTHSRQLLKHHDITMPQVLCLDQLIEKGAMTVASLASNIHLSASTTVGIIDRLEKKKLVKRKRDEVDRRSVYVSITTSGREFVLKTPDLLNNRMQHLLQKVAEKERTHIASSLELLVSLLKDETGS